MQISGVSLTLTWPHRLCLLRVLLCAIAAAASFPLSKHTGGGDTAPAFSGLRVYLQFMWEWSSPPLLWSFPPTATFTSFPALGCWACAVTPAFSSRLFYLQFWEGFPLPLSSVLRASCSLCYVSFLLLLLIIQFFFLLSLGGGPVCPGGYADLARVVCGSTACCLAHLVVCVFPSGLGAAVWWWQGSPPGFSV
jgi:hypothetical protein